MLLATAACRRFPRGLQRRAFRLGARMVYDRLGQGQLAALRELLGLDADEKRLERIRALSDAELLHAIEVLSDSRILTNVTVLEPLRAELHARGLSETKH